MKGIHESVAAASGIVRGIRIAIPGRIRGQGRPRFTKDGHAYKDGKTRSCEGVVKQFAALAMDGKPPLEGPVWLSVTIWQMPPPSWPKKKRAAAQWITGRPDFDNTAKLICDSCNGIVWRDDSQIAEARIVRRYALEGPERVEIEAALCGEAE